MCISAFNILMKYKIRKLATFKKTQKRSNGKLSQLVHSFFPDYHLFLFSILEIIQIKIFYYNKSKTFST